jgi:hypothetical protein
MRGIFSITSFAGAWLFASLLLAGIATRPFAQGADSGPSPAVAAGMPNLDISSQVDRSEITIGDRIVYEIKVVYPAEGSIELPSVLGNLGSFEVKDYEASDPKPAGNLKIQTWRFDLSTFTVGDYMIPPQQVVYLPPGASLPAADAPPAPAVSGPAADTAPAAGPSPSAGPRPFTFMTQPIAIKVVRTSPENVKDIADIAPLAEPPPATPWAAIALGAGAVGLLGGWFWWRRRRKAPAAEAEKPMLPPYEEAMERLAAINAGAMVRANRARELAFQLSEVLRRYVSRRFEVDALESTTTEFLALVPRLPVTQSHRQWIAAFCEKTDLVKFAGAGLLETDAADLAVGLRDFVRQTRPAEAATGEGKPGAKAGGNGNGKAAGPGAPARNPAAGGARKQGAA